MTTASDQADGLDDNESGESVMQEELLLLEAIYINELTLQKDDKGWPFCISVRLHPATGDVQEQQYVCLTLELSPPPDYPISPPGIHIRNPRGLAEEHITNLRKTLKEMAQERRGDPMLYELIECAKDSLTHGNVPHGHCVICRDDFDTETDFTRTACYHYFHSHCLLRYVKHSVSQAADEAQRSLPHSDSGSDEQVVCPVCREVITYDLAALGNAKTIPGGDDVFRPNASVRKLQRQMAALFKKQKAKGGIIDVEAEKNKFLLPQGPVYLPGVQEEAEAEVLPSETVCCSRDLLFKERVPQDGHDTRQCDIQDRRFKDYPSHRGRGRGRGRGRRWEQNLHLSDGDRHFGRPRSGRRNERNQGESQHNERRNETFPRESQQSERRNETNLRKGQRNERQNETFPREIQPNERRNETNLREGQQNERINETNLREGQTSERRNETNLREGQPNERRNEAFPRAGRRNEMTRQRRAPSGRVRQGAEGTSVGRPEKENVHGGMTSSSRETSSHESGRPQSGNRRVAGGRRGNRGRASHCPDPDRHCNRNPNPHRRDRCTGIIETDRKKTDCCTNPSVTSCPTPCREQGSKGERESVRENPADTLGKRPPPGFQMGNRPPPGFENISTGS